jgi:protein-S-isoprenylcysteine O-methyltransferase Ste14
MISVSTDVSVVTAQLAGWSLLLLLGDMEAAITTPYLITIGSVGLALVITSAIQLGPRSYSSSTRPRASNVLVRRGIYRFLRHPIYSGMLIIGLAIFLSRLTLIVGNAFLLLVLITNVRAGLEEKMLEERYPEYTEYKKRTKRYIPYVV